MQVCQICDKSLRNSTQIWRLDRKVNKDIEKKVNISVRWLMPIKEFTMQVVDVSRLQLDVNANNVGEKRK